MHFLIVVIMGNHVLHSKVSTFLHFSALLPLNNLSFVFSSSFSFLCLVRLHCFYMEPDKHVYTAHRIWQNTPGEVRCSATELAELPKWLGKICHPFQPPVLMGRCRGREILVQPRWCNRKQGWWLTWHDVENNRHTHLMDSVLESGEEFLFRFLNLIRRGLWFESLNLLPILDYLSKGLVRRIWFIKHLTLDHFC